MQPPTTLSRVATALLVRFFKLLYHPLAWSYDLVAWMVSLGKWKAWVLSILPDLPGPSILELGHGPGHLQASLAKKGITIFGLDESRQMGFLAKRRVQRAALQPRLVRGWAQWLPFPSASFHQVVSTFPSEYIFDPRTLSEVSRVLRPGGCLVVIPVAWLTGESWLERLIASLVHIAGQTPEWDEQNLAPFTQVGFTASVERREMASSQLIVIIARKDRPL